MPGIGYGRLDKCFEDLPVLRFGEVGAALREELVKAVAADSAGKIIRDKILVGDLCEQLVERLVGDSVVAAVLILEEDLGLCELGLAVTVTADLEVFLVFAAGAQEIGEGGQGEVGLEIRGQAACKVLVGFFVNCGVFIQAMDIAGGVSDDCGVLVSQGALGLVGDGGPVEPHSLCDEPSIVGQDAVLEVDEVLGVQRGEDHINILEGDAADDKGGGGVERGEGDALAGGAFVAGLSAKCVHRLDGLGLPVGYDVGVVLVEAEVPADVNIEVVFVAVVAEQGVALSYFVGGDEGLEPGKLFGLGGEAPGLKVEIEVKLVHYELLEAHQSFVAAFAFELFEAVEVAPGPYNGAHNVGQDEAVHQFRKYEDLHIGKGHRRTVFFQLIRLHNCTSTDSFPDRIKPPSDRLNTDLIHLRRIYAKITVISTK